jgi:hypothetical protein
MVCRQGASKPVSHMSHDHDAERVLGVLEAVGEFAALVLAGTGVAIQRQLTPIAIVLRDA